MEELTISEQVLRIECQVPKVSWGCVVYGHIYLTWPFLPSPPKQKGGCCLCKSYALLRGGGPAAVAVCSADGVSGARAVDG
jgi:hypothetical protein